MKSFFRLPICLLAGLSCCPASATTFTFDFIAGVAAGGALPATPKPATVADATTVLDRLAPAAYADGLGDPLQAGRPNPRDLSNALSVPDNAARDAVPLSNLAVAFAQLMASHEIARSPTNPAEDISVPVAADDPVALSTGGVPVMPQSRATAAPRNRCDKPARTAQ